MRRWPFLLAVLGAAFVDSRAELPPWVYQERQAKTPEALVIKVRSVKAQETKEPKGTVTEFTVEAEVVKVERSATKLAPGGIIRIVYSRREYSEPLVGPSELPVLKEGQVYPAYLARRGDIYAPAAGGYSFATVP
ncbi:MAG: hypothetical protein WAO00_03255 [Chthoniobacterales bacterium]